MRLTKTIIVALALAAGGCSTLDYRPIGSKETIKNADGHIVGYKERISTALDEEADRVVLYTPRRSVRGTVVAYEEHIKGGVVLRDVNGKRIGARYVDLRSRGTNPHSSGLTIVFMPRDAEQLAELHIAQVTIEDIKQYLGIVN